MQNIQYKKIKACVNLEKSNWIKYTLSYPEYLIEINNLIKEPFKQLSLQLL